MKHVLRQKKNIIDKTQVSSIVERSLEHFNVYAEVGAIATLLQEPQENQNRSPKQEFCLGFHVKER